MVRKTLSLKLAASNTGKLRYLEDLLSSCEKITRDYTQFKFRQLGDDKDHDFSKEQKEKYYKYRNNHPQLYAQTISGLLNYVTGLVKSHISWCKKKHHLVKQPEINNFHVPLNYQSLKLVEDDRHFQLWLGHRNIYFPIHLSDFAKEIWENSEKICCSQIIKKDDEFYFQLVLEISKENYDLNPDKAVGIDLGIVNPITCSDGKVIGNGDRQEHKKKEFQKKRSRAQKYESKITCKQERWIRDRNHKLSRQLIDYLISQGAGVLVLEDLKGDHLSNRRGRQYKWSFAELMKFIIYKAKLAGVEVVRIDPAWTSQTCSECGQKSKDNRKTQSLFECTGCGFRMNADVNAARNILASSGQDGPIGDPAQAA